MGCLKSVYSPGRSGNNEIGGVPQTDKMTFVYNQSGQVSGAAVM